MKMVSATKENVMGKDQKTLIDADKLKKVIHGLMSDKLSGQLWYIIDSQPKVDAVEVVNCGDCIFYRKFNSVSGRCVLMDIYPTPTWFCKCGTEGRDDIS